MKRNLIILLSAAFDACDGARGLDDVGAGGALKDSNILLSHFIISFG